MWFTGSLCAYDFLGGAIAMRFTPRSKTVSVPDLRLLASGDAYEFCVWTHFRPSARSSSDPGRSSDRPLLTAACSACLACSYGVTSKQVEHDNSVAGCRPSIGERAACNREELPVVVGRMQGHLQHTEGGRIAQLTARFGLAIE